MASIIVTQGLARIGKQASQASGYSVSRHIQTLAIDDSTVSFLAAHTALNSGGAVTNEFDVVFDSTPTNPSGATIQHLGTIPTGSGNFTIRRVSMHDDTPANVSTSSTTLVSGIDAQSLQKSADFSMTFTLNKNYTSV